MYFEHWLHHVCADEWYCFVSRLDILQVSFVDEGYISSIVGFLKIQQNYEQRWHDTSYSFSKLLYSVYNKTYGVLYSMSWGNISVVAYNQKDAYLSL